MFIVLVCFDNVLFFFLEFLEELSAVRQHCASEITPLHNANPPVFVACLQGAGRTGVTIASDLLLYTLEHNQVIFARFEYKCSIKVGV